MARFSLLILGILITACASVNQAPIKERKSARDIVWPLPPETPRIRFVKSFSDPEDFQIGQSFSESIRNFFAGAEDRSMVRPYSIAVNNSLMAVADPGAAVVMPRRSGG